MSNVVKYTKKIGLERLFKRIENRLFEIEEEFTNKETLNFTLLAERFLKNPNDLAVETLLRHQLSFIEARVNEMNQKELFEFLTNNLERLEIRMVRHHSKEPLKVL